ncbi:cell number regulator 8 [Magnolia sinica]|uniref:cell number regulator 8 n=1 Tax=Magnolia sinica TaxID=86752 RepID=UPI00265AA434|nr:cell number regulator 8 [Magnolia sinica]
MANPEEVSPLLTKKEAEQGKVIPLLTKKEADQGKGIADGGLKKTEKTDFNGGPVGWTADGLPLGHGSVLGEPVARFRWDSSLFACLGRNDDFCSSDLEVCLLGSFAPCILYGSNAERLGASPGTFANHCLPYTGLYLLGNSLFGSNYLAPWFSYPSRTAIRQKFNLEGSCEALSRSCGCCRGIIEDEVQRENCESACDFTTHFFCHTCALCQEGRELRRRLPHPGFNGRSVVVMIPPAEQAMGRGP